MEIILSGYGKMGKEIEKFAIERNHIIIGIIDTETDWHKLKIPKTAKPVVIDFSQPDVVVKNIKKCFEKELPVVVGTTGWDNHLDEIKSLCFAKNQSLLVGSNFSIGVNFFFAVNKYLASIMEKAIDYDVSMSETHHIHKLDKPSGTAVTLAKQILDSLERKTNWSLEDNNRGNELIIDSIREGEVFGDHAIKYSSEIDEIEIKHHAKSRKGFAKGAILAAEWLQGKKGVFGMEDVLGI